MARTRFSVSYDGKSARFSDYDDAMIFAKNVSATGATISDVYAIDGIVGQFINGMATDEFWSHWDAVAINRRPARSARMVQFTA